LSKLPDVNVLVALSYSAHPHHSHAVAWHKENPGFATCPVTELGLIRVLMQLGALAEEAFDHLCKVKSSAKFIPCDEPAAIIAGKIKSHKQTTDAYLLALAKEHSLALCTFDAGIKGAELVS
jgi:predicted nucleic acid-binding protein